MFLFFIMLTFLFQGGLFAQSLQGDVNSSKDVTIVDALLIAQYYVGGKASGFDIAGADVNCSGDITIVDALLIAQYYVNSMSQFPCEIPVNNPSGDGTRINMTSNSMSVEGSGAYTSGNKVIIDAAGKYNVYGAMEDGQIIVDTQDEEKVEITLNSVSITCLWSAPINIKNGEVKLYIEGKNYITDGTSYDYDVPEDEEPNAAIFIKDDLTIKGSGTLTIKANFNDGINCNDDLKISSGTLIITAKDEGMVGNESIEVNGGHITIPMGHLFFILF